MLLFIQRFLIANINNNYTNKNNTLNIMGFNIISAAEAASYIKHGYNIGLSGFTPAGTPKAVTPEVAKIAEEEHAKGNPFQISIFTGASTGDATDGILSRVKAIRYRAPYTTNPVLCFNEESFLLHFCKIFTLCVNLWPYRNHKLHAHLF